MSAKLFLMALGLGLVGLGISQANAPQRNPQRDGDGTSEGRSRRKAASGAGTDQSSVEVDERSAITEAFVQHAAIAEIYDVQAARIALNKGQNPDLRAFAAVLIKDHNDAAGAMKEATGGYPQPKALDREHQALIDRLSEVGEHEFDALYLEQQAKGQEAAQAVFAKFSEDAPNDTLRAFADKLIAAIKQRQSAIGDLML